MDDLREVGAAVLNLLRGRFVAGWGAVDARGDEHTAKEKAVVRAGGVGLACQSDFEEPIVEPVTASIAREHPARSIGTVGCGSEPNDEPCRIRIAKIRNGTTPILPVTKTRGFLCTDVLAPFSKAGAPFTRDDGLIELMQHHAGLYAG